MISRPLILDIPMPFNKIVRLKVLLYSDFLRLLFFNNLKIYARTVQATESIYWLNTHKG